jgi:hypothetical protein
MSGCTLEGSTRSNQYPRYLLTCRVSLEEKGHLPEVVVKAYG